MPSKLSIIINNKNIGCLVQENGETIFSYLAANNSVNEADYISLTMPVRIKDYTHNQLHPIFEMHLPEGYLLSIIKKHYSKLTKTDDFGLLKLMSDKISGRLNYELSYENTTITKTSSLTLDELRHPQSTKLFDELVLKFALSSSLSGVQPKVLAKVVDKATLGFNDYIVKSWGEDYPHLALNEYYCMSIVKKAKISVPEFYLSDDNKLFIMKRFDIKDNGTYLGFEDMCVLQARQRDDKYQGSYEQIAKTINIFVSEKNKKQSFIQFFKMIVINFLIQNGDAHLKNFGLLYEDLDNIKLAPAYDVVCTTVYIKNDIPALHLLGSKKWWAKKYLIRFGMEYCFLTAKESNGLFNECLVAIKEVSSELEQRLIKEQQPQVREILTKIQNVFVSVRS
ncbi:MAG: type II toxin-antitoxin system HipA family toxin [Pseudomonadota bacterium]